MSRVPDLLGWVWAQATSLLGSLADWARRLSRPIVVETTVTNTTSKRGLSSAEEEAFDALVARIDQAVEDYRKCFPLLTRVKYSLSLSGERVTHEQHLLTCSSCGVTNRLRRGVENAICGACKKPLAPSLAGTFSAN